MLTAVEAVVRLNSHHPADDANGQRRSRRIEARAALILRAIKRKSDITLAGLRVELTERRIAISVAGLSRFFARRKLDFPRFRLRGRGYL